MNLWRVQLKPQARPGVDPGRVCIDHGVIGIGPATARGPREISQPQQRAAAPPE